jgi:succinoglycan biosynthesis transport protein ExoP
VVESEMKSLYADVPELERSIEEYQRRIESTPLIEKEYIELTRDYEGLKHKYNDISNKLLEARVSQGMEASQRGERFVVVDTAPLPEKPYKPNRIAIIAFGFILALSAGLGLVAIKEAMDHSIKSVDELNQIAGLNVFSVVSYIETAEEKRKRKIIKTAWVICIIGLVAIAFVVVDQFVMSMDKIWIEIGQRFGII